LSAASATCSARKALSADALITAASTISPACTGKPFLSTVAVPSAATCSMVRAVASPIVTDFSECRKSPSDIVATWLLLSGDHAPIECGCDRA